MVEETDTPGVFIDLDDGSYIDTRTTWEQIPAWGRGIIITLAAAGYFTHLWDASHMSVGGAAIISMLGFIFPRLAAIRGIMIWFGAF